MIVVGWVTAVVTLAGLMAFALDAALGASSIRKLAEIEPLLASGEEWPLLSIVIAGRNEERNIEEALSSVLALDYPRLEIVFVNDRSTDRTGDVLRHLAASDARLRLVEVTTLPPHWLGKNHALHLGASAAQGEWLLFTDADVVYAPSTLRRAIAYALAERLDHLTAGAYITGPTLPLRIFISGFAFFFLAYSRPWRAASANPECHVGIGAFNLVRASKYREAGGHAPIAMRPDDDMKLAKLLKLHGGRQQLIDAADAIRVEWYGNVAEAVQGLEKNAFSGVEYSWIRLVTASIALLAFGVWPWIALFTTHGALRALNAAVIVLTLTLSGVVAAESGGKSAYALAFPVTTLLFLYILWNAALKAAWNGGIDWRGTKYPLAALRANRI
jgi:glycosyltransferase involved in cell wall biosynthesis